MNHSIKLEDHVYKRLQQFQDKRETYSQAIYRLLTLLDKVGELRNILEGQISFAKWKTEQLTKLPNADTVRRDVEARTLALEPTPTPREAAASE